MLVELGVVEQRYQAVLEVLNDGVSIVEVAARFGVTRQTVHRWLKKYAAQGLAGLVDGSNAPGSCPHQMAPAVEARIVAMRVEHPGWGPRTIGHWLAQEGVVPVPGRSSIHRCLVRHGLIVPEARKRKKADYIRWERSRSMELWQMDIVGGVRLVGGGEAKIVSGVDDHSRFCISAFVVERATARPTCDALALAMRRHGVPQAILTDNGKVFTGRFGPGTGEVLFDRICRENGIKHLLTAPRSPTTTGKVERFHRTLRETFLTGRTFESIEDAQAQLDGWVELYNHVRPHQGIGMVPPIERFRLAAPAPSTVVLDGVSPDTMTRVEVARRRVNDHGSISFASTRYLVGRWLAGENVDITIDAGVLTIAHRGVVVATHARRHKPAKEAAAIIRGQNRRPTRAAPRPSASTVSVTRKVDSAGCVSFAGASYRVGRPFARRQVQVAVVGATVEISIGEELIRRHPAKHDRTREHGALANPGGRPNRTNAA
ncbi:MAG: IS481 family transposase [Acidimicrobiia bacterium]